MSKKIIVCNSCKQPLIWTFAFPYAEYFCMNEFSMGGMFGSGHEVDATPELLATKKLYNRRWGQIKKHIVQGRFWRTDCKKCKTSDSQNPHNSHLTEIEKVKADWAINKLREYAGIAPTAIKESGE